MTVYFIGAGPGDPELITVKGQRLIRSCPVIIYAGSLVPAAVLEGHCAEQVVNSAELHLEQIIELIKSAHAKGQDVARVHSGDPSLYGAITSFRLRGRTSHDDNVALAKALLDKYLIFAVHRDGLASGACVRITPALATRMSELDSLVKAIRGLAG